MPNGITSSNCLLRVYDTNDPTREDYIDSPITILPSNEFQLTSPNGGEAYNVDQTVTITWDEFVGASGQYRLQYSTNGGTSWSTIANNITGTAYAWTVPNIPSTNYKIRIADYTNTCKYDDSDAVFTVLPNTPVVISPNGGESYHQACSIGIEWDTETFYSNVRIEYSTDNGGTYSVITTSTSNDGYYGWTVPSIASSNYLIKVMEVDDLSRFDISDATFTILPAAIITLPTAGTTVNGCDIVTVAWNHSCSGNFRLEYNIDGGAWSTIATVNAGGSTSSTSYWTVPNGITSSNCLLRVYDTNDPTREDYIDAPLNILPSNEFQLTTPNGGESYTVGEEVQITWTNLPEASGLYRLRYSTNSGNTWTTIVNNITGNAYNWTIPNIPSDSYMVRILDATNLCIYDSSDDVFEVAPLPPLVIQPNGGELWYAGTSQSITWDDTRFYSNVRIDYSTDSGISWNIISTSTSNDGFYGWTVPNEYSSNCLIRVSSVDDINFFDVSNTSFTIRPAVLVLSPNGESGSAELGGCTVTSITFERSPAWDDYLIQYSEDGGINWNTIVSSWNTTANPATYNWNIPNLDSDQVLVRVSPVGLTSYADESDQAFTIEQPIQLVSPNFGGILTPGSTHLVTWASDGNSNLYDLDYSVDNGLTWINIETAYNTSIDQYSWMVPNTISSNCYFRITDNSDNCKQDISDFPFEISNNVAPITVVTPNGGENLTGCPVYNITWSEPTVHGTYDILYSVDNGASWVIIESEYATTSSSYSWRVPAVASSNALVRVVQSGTTEQDLSDGLFTITPTATAPSITIAESVNGVGPGTLITFTTTVSDEGTSPSYQWQVNGMNVGTNSPTYASSSFVDGDEVTCILTSNATCILNATATSNSVVVSILDICNHPDPATLMVDVTSPTTATISWAAVPGAYKYQVRYKKKTDPESAWITTGTLSNSKYLTGLQVLKFYQVRVRTQCEVGGAWSPYFPIELWFQSTCPEPISLAASEYANLDTKVEWTVDDMSTYYRAQVKYRVQGSGTWTTVGATPGNLFKRINLAAMPAGAVYEIITRVYCDGDGTVDGEGGYWSRYSTPIVFDKTNSGAKKALEINGIYPNPTRSALTFSYNLPERMKITLEVYDLYGRRVMVEHIGTQAPGPQATELDVRHLDAGAYVLRLLTDQGIVKNYKFIKK